MVWNRSIADVNQYFKSVTLDFGGSSWFSASRTLDLSPEGYLIVSVSNHVFLASTNVLSSSPLCISTKIDFGITPKCIILFSVDSEMRWVVLYVIKTVVSKFLR